MELAIISPYAHLNGHYWPYTCDLMDALRASGQDCAVFAARPPRYQPTLAGAALDWHACCPWTLLLLTDSYRAKNWGSRPDSMVRNIEFHACLRKCLAATGGKAHIHCIESRHRILLREVCRSNATFSSLCVGDPPPGLSKAREEEYRRAFATGRLTFIVETDAVKKAWRELAGEHVVHIPAALPASVQGPLDQIEARRKLGLPENAFICLFFGTHREGKDYRLAIQAAQASSAEPFLLFVGPMISGNDPDALLAELGFDHALSWKGYFPDADVPTVFDACDVVMLPYADNYTKGSAVLLQACQFNKPVIATDTGHLREFALENHTGVLFTGGSIKSLASCYDQIGMLKRSNQLDKHFDFTKPLEKYSWERLVEKYLHVFHRAPHAR